MVLSAKLLSAAQQDFSGAGSALYGGMQQLMRGAKEEGLISVGYGLGLGLRSMYSVMEIAQPFFVGAAVLWMLWKSKQSSSQNRANTQLFEEQRRNETNQKQLETVVAKHLEPINQTITGLKNDLNAKIQTFKKEDLQELQTKVGELTTLCSKVTNDLQLVKIDEIKAAITRLEEDMPKAMEQFWETSRKAELAKTTITQLNESVTKFDTTVQKVNATTEETLARTQAAMAQKIKELSAATSALTAQCEAVKKSLESIDFTTSAQYKALDKQLEEIESKLGVAEEKEKEFKKLQEEHQTRSQELETYKTGLEEAQKQQANTQKELEELRDLQAKQKERIEKLEPYENDLKAVATWVALPSKERTAQQSPDGQTADMQQIITLVREAVQIKTRTDNRTETDMLLAKRKSRPAPQFPSQGSSAQKLNSQDVNGT